MRFGLGLGASCELRAVDAHCCFLHMCCEWTEYSSIIAANWNIGGERFDWYLSGAWLDWYPRSWLDWYLRSWLDWHLRGWLDWHLGDWLGGYLRNWLDWHLRDWLSWYLRHWLGRLDWHLGNWLSRYFGGWLDWYRRNWYLRDRFGWCIGDSCKLRAVDAHSRRLYVCSECAEESSPFVANGKVADDWYDWNVNAGGRDYEWWLCGWA